MLSQKSEGGPRPSAGELEVLHLPALGLGRAAAAVGAHLVELVAGVPASVASGGVVPVGLRP